MLEQKTSIEVGANQSSTQRVRPMPPCECADKISSTASAEFSDTKVLNVVTQSRVPDLRCRHRYWGRVRRRIARGRWLFRAFDLGGQARLIVSIFYELGGRIGSRLLDCFDLAIGGVRLWNR